MRFMRQGQNTIDSSWQNSSGSSATSPVTMSIPGTSPGTTPPRSKPRILELADRIGHLAAQLDSILCARAIPSPSFAEDAPTSYPPDTRDVRDRLIDAAAELYDLLLEPMAFLYNKTGVRSYLLLVDPGVGRFCRRPEFFLFFFFFFVSH